MNSFIYAGLLTIITLALSYPMAYLLSKTKHRQLWMLLVLLPTWINLLLKAYAFIGLLSQTGSVNQFLTFMGIGPKQLLFTDAAFLLVAGYIELPFMIMPIYNSITEIPHSLMEASSDLGASKWATLRRACLPTVYARRAFRDSGGLYSVLVPLHVDSSHWWEPGHYLGDSR